MRPRILLDCDGVMADFVGRFLALVNGRFGTMYGRNDIDDYDIAKALQWSRERATEAYGLIDDDPGFASHLETYPGAVDGVCRLQEISDLYVVTSPWWSHPTWVRDRNNWLYTKFGILASRVVHTAAKHIVSGDVLVDDKTSTCEEWRAAHPEGVAVLWSTPHNRRDLWDGPCTSSWDYLFDLVRGLT